MKSVSSFSSIEEQTLKYLFGGILLPPTCKINNVNMQHNYVNMRLIYVDMQHNYVDMLSKIIFSTGKFSY